MRVHYRGVTKDYGGGHTARRVVWPPDREPMHITKLDPLTLRDFAPPDDLERSPGLHLTQITGHIMRQLAPKRYGRDMPKADSENYQEAGFVWEDVLGLAFARRALAERPGVIRFRPPEVTRDDVAGSPDALTSGVQPDDPEIVVEEYKFTWKSARNVDSPEPGAGLLDEKFLGYLLQMQGYCAMVGTTRARLYIFFVNGTYQAMVPETRAYQFDFTHRELEERWRSYLNTARKEGWLE